MAARNSIAFQDLNLSLGDRLRISAPLLDFVAKGDLTLNGSLDEPRPKGTIQLVRGQVNIYTTLFTLAPGYKQTAVFTEQQGLDPTLNLRLITSVPEVTRNPLPPSPLSPSEVAILPTTTLGTLQTVRIEARVSGPASQLVDNLALTSSPARTSNEIIALLGGGFVNTLGRGDSTLALANLAGSALLTNLQARFGQALGIGQFRIFPAVIPRENKTNLSTIDIAAEAGVNLTQGLSASILGVLTSENPLTLFNLNYRVNDQIQLRGSTDFAGDSRFVVEYENRF